jgi:hypothetical protein
LLPVQVENLEHICVWLFVVVALFQQRRKLLHPQPLYGKSLAARLSWWPVS